MFRLGCNIGLPRITPLVPSGIVLPHLRAGSNGSKQGSDQFVDRTSWSDLPVKILLTRLDSKIDNRIN